MQACSFQMFSAYWWVQEVPRSNSIFVWMEKMCVWCCAVLLMEPSRYYWLSILIVNYYFYQMGTKIIFYCYKYTCSDEPRRTPGATPVVRNLRGLTTKIRVKCKKWPLTWQIILVGFCFLLLLLSRNLCLRGYIYILFRKDFVSLEAASSWFHDFLGQMTIPAFHVKQWLSKFPILSPMIYDALKLCFYRLWSREQQLAGIVSLNIYYINCFFWENSCSSSFTWWSNWQSKRILKFSG